MGWSLDDLAGTPPMVPATDLSNHVDGGVSSNAGSNANADSDSVMTVRVAGGIVVTALVALWLLGGFVFKGVAL